MKPISDGAQAFIDNRDYLYKTLCEEEQENYYNAFLEHHAKSLETDMSGDYKAELWAQQLKKIEADYRRQCFEEIDTDKIEKQHADQFAFAVVMFVIGVCIGAGSYALAAQEVLGR